MVRDGRPSDVWVFRMYLVPNDLRSTAIPAFDNVSKGESDPGLSVYH